MSLLARAVLSAACFAGIAGAQVAIWTHHNDLLRTGMNLSETVLTTSNVNATQFGRLFSYPVDASIYAQPLYIPNVAIAGKGTHNVVFVATMNNSVYAFDADSNAGTNNAPLWSVNYNNLAASIGPVPSEDLQVLPDISGPVGILGTPVIDTATNAMYFVVRTKENGSYFQRLHAIDIRSGAELANSPKAITATVPGTGSGSVGGSITFNPKTQNQRAALALANGVIYVAWASHNDLGPYHGWVMGYSPTTLQQLYVYNNDPNGQNGGIWQAGEGPVIDATGNLYFNVGNGDWDGTKNFSQSVVKLTKSLTLADYFTPDNWQAETYQDMDLGSCGLLQIPGSNYVLAGSKEGVLYLLSMSSMGHMVIGNTQIPQLFRAVNGHVHGTPVYWNSPGHGPMIYVWSENDYLKAFHFNGTNLDTAPAMQSTFQDPPGMPGGFLSISANGNKAGTGILWVNMPYDQNANQQVVPGILRAFDADNLSTELWNSHLNATRDDFGNFGKFAPPTVVKGKVYLATFSNQLVVYGILPSIPSITTSITPGSRTAAIGQSATYQLTVNSLGGFAGTVSFSATGLPAGVTAQFSPTTVSGGGTTTVTLTPGSTAGAGTYQVTITAASGSITSSQSVTLTVTSTAVSQTVDLSPYFNIDGMSNDTNPGDGNLDNYGFNLSANLVPSTITAGGTGFATGPKADGKLNAISTSGQTLTLPSGYYTSINLLALAVGGQQSGTFTLKYSDGTADTVNLWITDWGNPAVFGEATALTMSYRNFWNGKDAHNFYLFEYSLQANVAKRATSLVLPANNNIRVFAITAVPNSLPVSLTAFYNVDGISFVKNPGDGNLDGYGYMLSADLLGASIASGPVNYAFGPESNGQQNMIYAAGQTIPLPAGMYSTLSIAALAVNGPQIVTYKVNYTDGTSSSVNKSVTDWAHAPQFGEAIALTMAYRNNWVGQNAGTFYLFSYPIPLTAGKTPKSITLPANSNVKIAAMSLSSN